MRSDITWKDELKGITQDYLSKQMDYATARTLTEAAFSSRAAVQAMLKQKLNIRKPWLPRTVRYSRATHRKLEALVYFIDQATLVHLLEDGGLRRPERSRKISVPSKNMPQTIPKSRRPRRVLERPNVFIATINGLSGIWQKQRGNRLKLLYTLTPTTTYRRRTITFKDTVESVAPKVLERRLFKNLVEAIDRGRRR